MDINAILPLLMNKAGGKNEQAQTLMKLAQGEKPDVGTVMNLAMQNRRKSPPPGLKAVASVASCEIFGKLAKFFVQ